MTMTAEPDDIPVPEVFEWETTRDRRRTRRCASTGRRDRLRPGGRDRTGRLTSAVCRHPDRSEDDGTGRLSSSRSRHRDDVAQGRLTGRRSRTGRSNTGTQTKRGGTGGHADSRRGNRQRAGRDDRTTCLTDTGCIERKDGDERNRCRTGCLAASRCRNRQSGTDYLI